jgi:hypothetical protein
MAQLVPSNDIAVLAGRANDAAELALLEYDCQFVEYRATMESCSDKFHVDIPNVV